MIKPKYKISYEIRHYEVRTLFNGKSGKSELFYNEEEAVAFALNFEKDNPGWTAQVLRVEKAIIETDDTPPKEYVSGVCDVRIFQINEKRDSNLLIFADSKLVKEKSLDGKIDLGIYDEKWSGSMNARTLEDIFVVFNRDDRPSGTSMRSLSCSDIVEVKNSANGDLDGMWYCDSFGWRRIIDGKFEAD